MKLQKELMMTKLQKKPCFLSLKPVMNPEKLRAKLHCLIPLI